MHGEGCFEYRQKPLLFAGVLVALLQTFDAGALFGDALYAVGNALLQLGERFSRQSSAHATG